MQETHAVKPAAHVSPLLPQSVVVSQLDEVAFPTHVWMFAPLH